MSNQLRRLSITVGVIILTACTIAKNHPQDPYENFNRPIHNFNVMVDKTIYKPVGQVYRFVTPKPVSKAIGNFFANLRQIPTVANDLLQAEFKLALQDSTRFILNSTLGIGGLMDVAINMGLKPHYTDFGLTLAHWGDKKSPYLVIPFAGPSTIRDTFAWPVDGFMTVYPYIEPLWISYSMVGLNYVNLRAELLEAEEAFPTAKFEDYEFIRDAYLQRRASLLSHDDKPSILYVEE